jgi:hypothetical protein
MDRVRSFLQLELIEVDSEKLMIPFKMSVLTLRSRRPDLSKAGSSESGLFVAAMTLRKSVRKSVRTEL